MLESHLCPDLIITGGLHFPLRQDNEVELTNGTIYDI